MNKISLISLGCSKNQVDAERMLAVLAKDGFALTADLSEADAVIVNTCGFIESARAEAIENILEVAELKKEGKLKAVIVSGCMAERYRDEIKREMPEVDAILGIGSIEEISKACKAALCGDDFKSFLPKEGCARGGERILQTPPYTAYLKIADGCDNRCAFCAIPSIRGNFISRPIEELVAEAQKLCESGVSEITLVAQDTTRYGEDIYGKPMLAELLTKLCEVDFKWIRVLYSYADRITENLVSVIKNEPKIVKYLDIPIQHLSDAVLKRMNRRDTYDKISVQVKNLRREVPGIILRTTVMVGFPGETEEDFALLCERLEELSFDRLGVFAFSSEEGTPAEKIEDNLSQEEKNRRAEIVMEAAARRMEEKNAKQVGKSKTVLVEGFDKAAECYFGRSADDAPEVDGKVFLFCKNGAYSGQYREVLITEVCDCDLVGTAE